MKRLKIMLCAAAILLSGTSIYSNAMTDSEIPVDITVNGIYIKTDAQTRIEDGTTYVPVRFVSEALGAESISWDEGTGKVIITGNGATIEMQAGKASATVNGVLVTLAKKVEIINDRVFVPARLIAEALGAQVSWDSEYFDVDISKSDITVSESLIEEYTQDDLYWLAHIINAESEGQSMEGKIAVGNVVLNRVKSESFPDTIYDVIFDSTFGVQFQPVANGSVYNEPTSESIIAAKRALRGENIAGESLYFLNPVTASNTWIIENRTFYTKIEDHEFYL